MAEEKQLAMRYWEYIAAVEKYEELEGEEGDGQKWRAWMLEKYKLDPEGEYILTVAKE